MRDRPTSLSSSAHLPSSAIGLFCCAIAAQPGAKRADDDNDMTAPIVTLRNHRGWSNGAEFFERLPSDYRATNVGFASVDGGRD